MIDAAAALAKWQGNTQSAQAQQAYRNGIQQFQGNPMALAAAKKDKWLAGIQQAAASGKWESALQRTPVEQWRGNSVNIGTARLGTGVQKGAPKMGAFLQQFIPFLQTVKSRVDGMPDTTLEDRLAKMVENARLIAQFRQSGQQGYR